MDRCTACWQGFYVNGVCNRCNYTQKAELDRKSGALALKTVLKNRYLIGAVLGKGGFGITYSAWDNLQRRKVALKELYPNTSVTRASGESQLSVARGHEDYFYGMKAKFKEEAQLLYRFNDDCDIVKVYDLFEGNNTVYYAMEYLEGCDLNVYRKQHGLLSWQFLQPIVLKLLQTLSVLHKRNLIHRDISPDNIFLLKNNTVKLIDFGAARTYQGNFTFTVMKKEGFAPIEQTLSTGKQGPWTDIYALSATMYLLLSGKMPPSAEDRKRREKTLIPLKQLCPTLPDFVAAAIEKGMSLEIADRFSNAEDYMRALRLSAVAVEPTPRVISVQKEKPKPNPKKLSYCLYGRGGIYNGKRKILTEGKEILLGRRQNSDIVFPETIAGVSRQQCVLFVNPSGEVFVKDGGSSYGTFLNNNRLGASWVRMYPGNRIRFGLEIFELVITEQVR